MESKAVLKNVGISTKKARVPASIVRGMSVVEALTVLKFMRKGTAPHIAKAISSAAGNAVNKNQSNIADLFVSDIRIDKGNVRIKHYHPKARGNGYAVWQRGKSHITVILKDKNEVSDKKAKNVKEVEPKREVKEEKKSEVKVAKTKKVTKPKTSTAKAVKPAKAK
jgi:large subunit ribosomal protein L22